MPNLEYFRRDLEALVDKLKPPSKILNVLTSIIDKLTKLHMRGIVKINHSVMEVIVSHYLLRRGFEFVDVEHPISANLRCDVFGVKGESKIIVEIETGFTPPENSLDPISYLKARIASKIARYGFYAEKFSLAIPPYYLPPLPIIFSKPPRARSLKEAKRLKCLLDTYYKRPPISLDEILHSRLHSILIINIDTAEVEEVDPESYLLELHRIYDKYLLIY